MEDTIAEQSIKELEKENLSLKFAAVHKDLQTFREEIDKHLRLILEQTSKTNGSVARVIQQIYDIEDNNKDTARDIKELKVHMDGTKFWYTIQTNKWIVIPITLSFYVLSIKEVRDLIINLLK